MVNCEECKFCDKPPEEMPVMNSCTRMDVTEYIGEEWEGYIEVEGISYDYEDCPVFERKKVN